MSKVTQRELTLYALDVIKRMGQERIAVPLALFAEPTRETVHQSDKVEVFFDDSKNELAIWKRDHVSKPEGRRRLVPDAEDRFAQYIRECGREILLGDPDQGPRMGEVLNKYFPEANGNYREDDDLVNKYAEVQGPLGEYIEAWLFANCDFADIERHKQAIHEAGVSRKPGPLTLNHEQGDDDGETQETNQD